MHADIKQSFLKSKQSAKTPLHVNTDRRQFYTPLECNRFYLLFREQNRKKTCKYALHAAYRSICIGISIRLHTTTSHSFVNAIHLWTDFQPHGPYRKLSASYTRMKQFGAQNDVTRSNCLNIISFWKCLCHALVMRLCSVSFVYTKNKKKKNFRQLVLHSNPSNRFIEWQMKLWIKFGLN